MEQVDILWHCLVEDAECYDDALHWFLNQVRSKDQHAMGMETYKHLFLEKVGTENKNLEQNVILVLFLVDLLPCFIWNMVFNCKQNGFIFFVFFLL